MTKALRHRHLEIAAVLAAPCLAIWALVAASRGLDVGGLLAAAVGYAAADLLAGTLHWYCDELADPSWPWIGRAFIHPFRDHHDHPDAITRHGVFELCGNNAIASSVFLAAILPWASSVPHVAIGVVAFAFAILATNVFHRWAHLASPPPLVRALQSTRTVLSPAAHRGHHATLDRAYCVTSGWTNPVLDAAIRCVRSYRQSRERRGRWQRT